MPRTAIDICNRALTIIGADDIASLTDEGTEARACQREYAELLGEALEAPGMAPYRWAFATAQAVLSRLAAEPLARYSAAYQLPADMKLLHAVMVGSRPIPFAQLDDMIYCDAADTDEVVVEYTFYPDPSAFPAYFVGPFTTDLASRLAVSVTRDLELAAKLEAKAVRQWAGARAVGSQARTSRRIRATRLTSARFSNGGGSVRPGESGGMATGDFEVDGGAGDVLT